MSLFPKTFKENDDGLTVRVFPLVNKLRRDPSLGEETAAELESLLEEVEKLRTVAFTAHMVLDHNAEDPVDDGCRDSLEKALHAWVLSGAVRDFE